MVDWVQEGMDAPKTPTEMPPKPASRSKPDGVSARTLMGRLERQSGQLAVIQAKLDDTVEELERQRDEARLLRQAFEDERSARERLQTQVTHERTVRQEAERSAEEAHVTVAALESQLQLLRAQLASSEDKNGRRRLFGSRR
jgi:chromosome segregation ATPase